MQSGSGSSRYRVVTPLFGNRNALFPISSGEVIHHACTLVIEGREGNHQLMLVDESPLYACTWMHEVYKVEDKALERPQQVLVGPGRRRR
jgi:hypothetical protein